MSPSIANSFSGASLLLKNPSFFFQRRRNLRGLLRAFDSESDDNMGFNSGISGVAEESKLVKDVEYPSGDFVYREYDLLENMLVKFKMLVAFPWERVKKGSVLTIKLRGEISDQLKSRFSSGLSLPQICENFVKAAYDPRISGVYLQIEPLSIGWGKAEEIRRHVLDFKKSVCGLEKYYIGSACDELYAPPSAYFQLFGLAVEASFLGGVLEKIGIEPQVQRIGKYKSTGDRIARKNISNENREMLMVLLDNIFENWVEKVSVDRGKKKEDILAFINDGVYEVERLKEERWITDIKYDDEVTTMLKERLSIPSSKNLPTVDYRKYSRVRKWTLGMTGYKDQIAILRASGAITRVQGPLLSPSSGIVAEQFIEKIRKAKDSKNYKAVVICINSPGGDALASDLMWREIKLLAASKPVVASMSDVAASGGYYMAMAAQTIVAETLTLTGSIGVVTGKFSLERLYEKIGFNKEIISRGRYAELTAAEQRPFRPDEAELFAKSAEKAYRSFRDKAAASRSMPVEKMEEVAQGRVWTGNDAASRGLVDAIGGLSRAIAIAKVKANFSPDEQVTLVELSKPSTSLPEILSGVGSFLGVVESAFRTWIEITESPSAIQARMDRFMPQPLEGSSFANLVANLVKEFFTSL